MTYKTRISPTAIARASRCLHAWYLQCHGDPLEKHEEEILEKILRYNLDDVLAMEVIDQELEKMVP